jgi:hypothetical protein
MAKKEYSFEAKKKAVEMRFPKKQITEELGIEDVGVA